MQQRVESSPLGRLALSIALVLLLVCVTAINMPPSRLRELVLVPGGPALRATGLDQDWRIFAPDPRDRVIRLEGEVAFADGHRETWHVPRGGALVGAYWDYRWQKWMEHVLLDEHAEPLWKGATDYIARSYARPGAQPTEVSLKGLERVIPPPGSGSQPPGGWTGRTFYRATVTTSR